MRFFAALYAAAAVVLAFTRAPSVEPISWLGVCGAAAALALSFALKQPLVMLSAAHAGLSATWAGTLAARMVTRNFMAGTDLSTMWALLGMCAGLAVLVSLGLKQKPQLQPVKIKPSRR